MMLAGLLLMALPVCSQAATNTATIKPNDDCNGIIYYDTTSVGGEVGLLGNALSRQIKYPDQYDQIQKEEVSYIADIDKLFDFYIGLNKGAEKYCSDKPASKFAAYVYTYNAYRNKVMGGDWKTPMNRANQLLAKCVAQYYGKDEGARCETLEEANIQLKIQWTASELQQ